MNKQTHEMLDRLARAGISQSDAYALRRIAMTLHRWHELECGDGSSYGSWAIERDDNGDGLPYLVHHHYAHKHGLDSTTRTRVPDRETGAKKRLAKIMTGYPALLAYVQTDPRGASLYILRKDDIPAGADIDSCYSRGIAVYR